MEQRVDMAAASPIPEPLLGHWWQPDHADQRVAGTLRLGASGDARLELIGLLTNGHPENRYPVVLGITGDGIPVTLEGLQQVGRSGRSSRFLDKPVDTEVLGAAVAYSGAHLETPAERTFDRAYVGFQDLPEWAGDWPLKDQYGPDPVEVSVRYTRPESREAPIPFGMVRLANGWAVKGDGLRLRTIESNVSFAAEVNEKQALEQWLRRVIHPLRHLLTFATDRPNEVTELSVRTNKYDPTHGTEVEVFYPHNTPEPNVNRVHAFEFLFDARYLGATFGTVVAKWFKVMDEIGPVVDLFLAPRYRPITFIENHFLNVVASAEAYHRARFSNTVLPREEHSARIEQIIALTPSQYQSWLKDKLAFSNEPALRERLTELLQSVPAVLPILGSATEFVRPVVAARNALTHRESQAAANLPSGRMLLRYIEETSVLLSACLLKELGFDDERAGNAIRNTRRFRLLTEVLQR
jgi:ApeA-like protein/HEPN superfamily Apea-like protein